jgi:hypothetical protein
VCFPPEVYGFLDRRTIGISIATIIGTNLQKVIGIVIGDEIPWMAWNVERNIGDDKVLIYP